MVSFSMYLVKLHKLLENKKFKKEYKKLDRYKKKGKEIE